MPTFQVNDMTCGHCVATITKAVAAVDAAANVQTDLGAHLVRVDSAQPALVIEAAIRDAGYTPVAAAARAACLHKRRGPVALGAGTNPGCGHRR